MTMPRLLVVTDLAPRERDRHGGVRIAAVLDHLRWLAEPAIGEPRGRFHALVELAVRIGHDREHEVGDRAAIAGLLPDVGHETAWAATGIGGAAFRERPAGAAGVGTGPSLLPHGMSTTS